jgi:PAS domain S-box-containing protein
MELWFFKFDQPVERRCAVGLFDDRPASTRQVLDAMPSGLAFVDLESTILEVNHALEILTGYERSELIGQNAAILVPRWNQVEHEVATREIMADSSAWRKWRNDSLSLKRKDGSEIAVDFALSPLVLDDQQLVAVAIRDNSALEGAEWARARAVERAKVVEAAAARALSESEERFRLAFEDNMAPMVFSDRDGMVLAVNDAFCQLVGRSGNELVGHDSSIFTLPEDIGISEQVYRRINSGEIDRLRYVKRLLHKNGRVIDVEVSVSPARSRSGLTLYFVSSVRDVTDQGSPAIQVGSSGR